MSFMQVTGFFVNAISFSNSICLLACISVQAAEKPLQTMSARYISIF